MKVSCCILLLTGLLAAQTTASGTLKASEAELAAGRYADAIKKAEDAERQFQGSGDLKGQGNALTIAGLAYLYSGDYSAALHRLNDALDLARRTQDASAEVTRLNNIASVYYFEGEYSAAMERYQEALRRVESFPNEKWNASRRHLTIGNIAMLYQTLGQFQRALELYTGLLDAPSALPAPEQAQLLSNMGALRRRLGDPVKALATYRSAQAIYHRSANRNGEIAVLDNIGIVQAMDLNDFKGAVATFSEALQAAEQSGDRPLAVQARLYRGEALYRAGKLDESAGDFDIAAQEAAALHEAEENWKALYGLARTAAAKGDVAKSDELLRRAVDLIESLRVDLSGAGMRAQFLADKRDVYDLLMEHAAAPQDAFRLMEQSRARNLRDRLHAAPQHDLRTFAQTLPRGNAVLEYWLGKSSAAVLWITSEGTGMKRLALSAEDRAAITALPAMLADPERSDWRLTAQRVADRILNVVPILGRAGVERIKIIPDGDLARIPFEALPTADARLLIQHYAVSYAASAALIRSSTEKRAIRWPWQTTFEAFADPVPGSSESGVDLVAVRDGQRLPSANSEVMTIAKIVGGRSAVYLGADARKTYLERDTPAPVLHFATHAYADPQNPDRSYILLAPSSASQRFDYLFLKEVYSLPLKSVDLATVSACESDAGKLIAGEGVESFTRAFLAAGARSVVTSLWSVGDRSTAALMVRFYSALADGMSKADALRAAKLDFIRASSASHPAFWAAFIINGDSDSRIPYVVSWLWLLAPAVAAALCAVVVVRTRAGKA